MEEEDKVATTSRCPGDQEIRGLMKRPAKAKVLQITPLNEEWGLSLVLPGKVAF